MHRAAGRRPPLRCGEQGGAQGSAETGGPAACGQKRSRQCEKGTERAARGGRMAGTCCPRSACVQAQVALGQVRLRLWDQDAAHAAPGARVSVLARGAGPGRDAGAPLRSCAQRARCLAQAEGPCEASAGRTPGRAVRLGRRFVSDQLGGPGSHGREGITLAGEHVGRTRERRTERLTV